jgi:hypothetical protein
MRPSVRTPAIVVSTVLLLAGALALAPPAAAALPYTSLQVTDQANGQVTAQAYSKGIVYLGGEFTQIFDHNGNAVTRNHAAAINVSTGKVTSWNPNVDGPVYAIKADANHVYLGGHFTTVGGTKDTNLTSTNKTNGKIASGWTGKAGYVVRDLLVNGSTLYVGGGFDKLSGATRTSIGAVSTNTGAIKSFDAHLSGPGTAMVRSLAMSPDGTRLYLGGYFTSLNGQSAYHIGAVDPTTGATKPFAYHPSGSTYPDDMQANATGLFVGFAGKGTDLHGIGSFNLTTGASRWVFHTCGDTQDLELVGSTMYIAGHLRCIKSLGQWPVTGLGAVAQSNGAPVQWGVKANIGCPKGCLGPWDLELCGSVMCVGGDSTRINGKLQSKFAVLQ